MSPMNTYRPIEISYRWDYENFKKAFDKAYDFHYKSSKRRYIGWFLIAMLQFGVVAALKGGSVALLLFATLLLLYWYVIKRWLIYRREIALFERSPLKNRHVVLYVTNEGITQSETSIPWDEIRGIVPVGEDVMLYEKDKISYIPQSAFETLEEKSRFKRLAKEKGKLYG